MVKSNIEYCDQTLNIITGCCYECKNCYARATVNRFKGNVKKHLKQTDKYTKDGDGYVLEEPFITEDGKQTIYPFGFAPTLHRYKAKKLDKLKDGHNILVGLIGDMFGEFIPDSWIEEVFEKCKEHPLNNYMFLTKNPIRYNELPLPEGDNMLFGTSVSTEDDCFDLEALPKDRKRFIVIEPIRAAFSDETLEKIADCSDWIVVGAETGNFPGKVKPEKEWIDSILKVAKKKGVPIFLRDNLEGIMGEEMVKEYPEQLQRKEVSPKKKKILYATCSKCGNEFKKSDMFKVGLKQKREASTKLVGYLCEECTEVFCAENGWSIPK